MGSGRRGAVCHTRAVHTTRTRALQQRFAAPLDWSRSHPRATVLALASVMVVAQLGFRAWAGLRAFFYVDDYILVDAARDSGLSLPALTQPYDSQFMPFGRFVAWIASLPDPMSYPLLVSTTLVVQALASVACVWMLVTLFGWRRQVLVPLAFYLTGAMTMPAFMWWAAALNQVPLQAVFFASVAAWVHYLRSRRLGWLALTLVVLGLGLLCYVKTLFLFPVLALLALGWFASGGPVRRVVSVVRRYWPAVLAGVVGGTAYLLYYASAVPQIGSAATPAGAGELADRMVVDTFAPALFGGPWRWNEQIAPVAQADAPGWAVAACWVAAALLVGYLALRRERTLRAWVLLAGYVAADFVLLLITRAQVVGAVSGTEYRYLTDAACAVVLALGLACMELRGAVESSRPRTVPLLTRGLGRRWAVAGTVAVALSGVWSSWSYARVWHDNHPGATYFRAAVASAAGAQEVDLADQFLPPAVTGVFDSRANSTRVVLPLLDPALRFPAVTDDLHVVDDDGRVVQAGIDAATSSTPGPVPRCGWAVRSTAVTIPLETAAIDVTWWVRLDYLSSQDSAVRVTAGATEVSTDVRRGLGSLFLRAPGPFAAVRVEGIDPGVTLCVDTITVGQPVATDVAVDQEQP